MGNRIGTLLVVFMLLALAGLASYGLTRSRVSHGRVQCRWNLINIGLGLHNAHDWNNRHFPPATAPSATLAPEKRLSWLIDVLSAFGVGGGPDAWWPVFDTQKAWDDPANWPITERNRKGDTKLLTEGYYDFFICPADPARRDHTRAHRTEYVGLAGVGADAAGLPLGDPRAGFFGHDRKITHADIKDGHSNTIMVCETTHDNGRWNEGGGATVRGLAAGAMPYLGEHGQFRSRHRDHAPNVAFADASVRSLRVSISPKVLEALVTIAGREAIQPEEFD